MGNEIDGFFAQTKNPTWLFPLKLDMLYDVVEKSMIRIPSILRLTLIFVSASCLSCSPAKNAQVSASSSQQNPPQDKPALAAGVAYDQLAAFLCGQATSSPLLQPFQETAGWKNFASFMETSWAELDRKRLKPMRDWAQKEFAKAIRDTKVLFYPFGGPDFMTAYQLFPTAETYILLGLEFVGSLPEFENQTPKQVEAYLENLEFSLSDFLKKSYFITHDMNESLQPSKVHGILPLLCFFVKEAGASIVEIRRLEVDSQGDLLEKPYQENPKKVRRPYGIRVLFQPAGSRKVKSLYYFSCDLADTAFARGSKLFIYLDKMGRVTTFLKSASYLLHYKEFSNIRNMILAKSAYILEDDTGIPYRYFLPKDWEVQLYGQYIRPVKDFSGVEQPDLKAAYSDPSKVKPLPFHLGYHWGSNLDSLLFIKRISPLAESR